MPGRNVNLTKELDRFVRQKVKSGRYENASEVIRAALRALQRDEQLFELKLAEIRGTAKTRKSPDPSIVFNLGSSGGSDITKDKHTMIGEAFASRR